MIPAGSISLSYERVAGERPRYTAEIVLVPGRWCSAAVWRPMMGFLAHRGWECTALSFHPDPAAGWATHRDALVEHIASYPAPPVVVGHDSGALLALALKPQSCRAVVALAPLIPSPSMATLAVRWSAWRHVLVNPPRGRTGVELLAGAVRGGTRPESPALLGELRALAAEIQARAGVATLLMAGAADRISPPNDVYRLADRLGAECTVAADASHPMPWGPGWDKRVGELHRWLIRTLGEALLIPPEEED